MRTQILYRPVGIGELKLIIETGYKAFPPRLAWQPIFYPVLNQQYAEQIAGQWNTEDQFSGYCGIVTMFRVQEEHYSKYAIQNVGGEIHNELWIPAEELGLFNQHIVGNIEVIKAFFGSRFIMPADAIIAEVLLQFKTTNNEL